MPIKSFWYSRNVSLSHVGNNCTRSIWNSCGSFHYLYVAILKCMVLKYMNKYSVKKNLFFRRFLQGGWNASICLYCLQDVMYLITHAKFYSPGQYIPYLRFEVFTPVTIKNAVLWDVAPWRSCVNRRFGGPYRLHLQGRKIRWRGTSVSRWLQTTATLRHIPEDGILQYISWYMLNFVWCIHWLFRYISYIKHQMRGPHWLSRCSYRPRRTVGVRFPVGERDFSLLHRVQTGSGAHRASYPKNIGAPVVKRPRRDAEHSPLSSAEVNYGEAMTSLPHMSLCFVVK
jgi:hypothetical protein